MIYQLHHGDCLDRLKELADSSVDSIVTDPPYGLAFMGKRWDYDVPSQEIWQECHRVLKPGGHLLAFAGTRTQHRMAVRIEDAGFEIRDMIAWVYGSGFPKSLDVSKALDKAAGRIGQSTKTIKQVLKSAHDASGKTLAELNAACGFEASGYFRCSSTWATVLPTAEKWAVMRDVLGLGNELDETFAAAEREIVGFQRRGASVNTDFMSGGNHITAPATDAARRWQGWGTALKPALEPITVARKPLVGTVAENVLAHGTGALNIDASRVGTEAVEAGRAGRGECKSEAFGKKLNDGGAGISIGRWPANLIHDGSDEVVALAGEQARFFYCAKASKRDRDEGLEGFAVKQSTGGGGGIGNYFSDVDSASGKFGSEKAPSKNFHPTVKPTDLMRYLCRLVTPPNGVVLDPFMGSGSTGKAAKLEGFQFIGIERESEYLDIARARIAAVLRSEQHAEIIQNRDLFEDAA